MADTPEPDPNAQILGRYLCEHAVLVADPHAASRAGVARAIIGLGAKTNQVLLSTDYASTIEIIRQKRPPAIVTEYYFPEGSALDFCKELRDAGVDPKDSFFVILTNDSSQSAVAQAAEEDVDCYILKPYTLDSFKEHIIAAAATKFSPNPYHDAIKEGKRLLSQGQSAEALTAFQHAIELSTSPSLAMSYMGQTERILSRPEDSQRSYKGGLGFNPIHYRCLIGLFDLFMEQSKLEDAYGVLTSISKVFPTNPKRLAQTVKLIILTKNYQEIEVFYEAFKQVEFRNPELVKICCAALITCARFFLRTGDERRGVTLLNHAAVSAAGQTSFLKQIVLILCEFKKFDEAFDVLKRFPMDMRNSPDFLLTEFVFEDSRRRDPLYSLHFGRKLIYSGLKDVLVYRSLVQALAKTGKKDELEDCLVEIGKLWPDQKEEFLKLARQEPCSSEGSA